MRSVLIGCSGHINYVLNGVRNNDDIELVGVAPGNDVDNVENLRKLSAEHNCPFFDNHLEMLDKTTPDVAGIATRYDLNGPVSTDCLERGIHCLTEKAIAHDLETLDRIRKTANENNARIVGMHAMRYSPHFYAAFKAVRDGGIGRPMVINSRKSYKWGNRRPEFYKKREYYGGTILWVASHAIDWTHWMLGVFSSLQAFHSTDNNFDYGDCEASSIISMTLKNGALGSISADYYQPQKAAFHGDDQVRIAGEKGIVEVKYGKAYLTTHEEECHELHLEEGDFFKDFCDEVAGRGKCRLSMEDTIEVTRLCILARDSADQDGVLITL